MIRWSAPALILPCLASCATTEARHYPSLLPRATEAVGFEEPAAPPAAPVTADPALDARIAELTAALAERAAAFDAAAILAEKRAAAAKGAPAGSETWLDSQTALGDLDVIRADAGEPATTLEQMALNRAVSLGGPYPRLEAAAAEARARVDAMSARIRAIQSAVAS